MSEVPKLNGWITPGYAKQMFMDLGEFLSEHDNEFINEFINVMIVKKLSILHNKSFEVMMEAYEDLMENANL